MANAPKGKAKEAMKDAARPPSPEEAFERFKALTQRIISVPKAEVDERAKLWAKGRGRRKRAK